MEVLFLIIFAAISAAPFAWRFIMRKALLNDVLGSFSDMPGGRMQQEGHAVWSQGGCALSIRGDAQSSAYAQGGVAMSVFELECALPRPTGFALLQEASGEVSFGSGKSAIKGRRLEPSAETLLSFGDHKVWAPLGMLLRALTPAAVSAQLMMEFGNYMAGVVPGKFQLTPACIQTDWWTHPLAESDSEAFTLALTDLSGALVTWATHWREHSDAQLLATWFEPDHPASDALRIFALQILAASPEHAQLHEQAITRVLGALADSMIMLLAVPPERFQAHLPELPLATLQILLHRSMSVKSFAARYRLKEPEVSAQQDALVGAILAHEPELDALTRANPHAFHRLMERWPQEQVDDTFASILGQRAKLLHEDAYFGVLRHAISHPHVNWGPVIYGVLLDNQPARVIHANAMLAMQLGAHRPDVFADLRLCETLFLMIAPANQQDGVGLLALLSRHAPVSFVGSLHELMQPSSGLSREQRKRASELHEQLLKAHGSAHLAGALSVSQAAGGELSLAGEQGAVSLTGEEG